MKKKIMFLIMMVTVFVCLAIGCGWIIIFSYHPIANLIALIIGVVFPTIVLAIYNPLPWNIPWWGMLLSLLGFLIMSAGTVGLGHQDLVEQKTENGVTVIVSTGIGVLACGTDMFLLYMVVTFFVKLFQH